MMEVFNLELVSKELNHLAAILHVYAVGLIFMKFFLLKIVFEKLLIVRFCLRQEMNYLSISSSKNISITIGHSRSVFSYPLDAVCL